MKEIQKILIVKGFILSDLVTDLIKKLEKNNLLVLCKERVKDNFYRKEYKFKGSLEKIFKELIEKLLEYSNKFEIIGIKIEKVRKLYHSGDFVLKLTVFMRNNPKNKGTISISSWKIEKIKLWKEKNLKIMEIKLVATYN